MNFEEAIDQYTEVAHTLISLRSGLRDGEERLAKLEALMWMQDEVQAGSNEKARRSLFEAARDQDDEYQNLLRSLRSQRELIAEAEIVERVARKWADYQIAISAPATGLNTRSHLSRRLTRNGA